jgi:hypothetical protein
MSRMAPLTAQITYGGSDHTLLQSRPQLVNRDGLLWQEEIVGRKSFEFPQTRRAKIDIAKHRGHIATSFLVKHHNKPITSRRVIILKLATVMYSAMHGERLQKPRETIQGYKRTECRVQEKTWLEVFG